MSRDILYIGMDESNHGELKSRTGEIIVVTWSYNKRFWDYDKHPNRRDYSVIEKCLNKGVDYIYTILRPELAKKNYSNLPLSAPALIHPLLNLKGISEIKLGLDGRLRSDDKKQLIQILEESNLKVTVANFVKKNGVHFGPELIYLSHLIANQLFRELTMLKIGCDSHYVHFDMSKI